MGRFTLPGPERGPIFLRAAVGALTTDTHAPSDLQQAILRALVQRFTDHDPRPGSLEPIDATDAATVLDDPDLVDSLAHLVVALELLEHPLDPDVERHAETYLRALGAEPPALAVARDTAEHHLALLHADIIRSSWTTEQTIGGIFHGRLLELARSKLSYYGVGTDDAIARRWRALGECDPGTWGRGVFEFYELHAFPFPGEKHGIYEVGARHDWIHVLADYDTGPEGEIDVFAFIAGTMADPKGFVQFLFTLALFQNASVDTVGGKKVAIARADTLADPAAADRLADALWRAAQCSVDPMGGTDVWAHADRDLDELRVAWDIPPKQVPGPSWRDLPA
jgi:hypothetical protein